MATGFAVKEHKQKKKKKHSQQEHNAVRQVCYLDVSACTPAMFFFPQMMQT